MEAFEFARGDTWRERMVMIQIFTGEIGEKDMQFWFSPM